MFSFAFIFRYFSNLCAKCSPAGFLISLVRLLDGKVEAKGTIRDVDLRSLF